MRLSSSSNSKTWPGSYFCMGGNVFGSACAVPVARNSAATPVRSNLFIFAPALGFSFVPWPSPSPIVLVTMLHFSGLTIGNAFVKRVELLARASILALIPIQFEQPLSTLALIPKVGRLCAVALAFCFDAVFVVAAYFPKRRSPRLRCHEHRRCQEQRSDAG